MVFSSRIIRSIIIIIGSRLTSLQILIYLSASNDMGVGKRFQNLEALSFVNYHAAIEWGVQDLRGPPCRQKRHAAVWYLTSY